MRRPMSQNDFWDVMALVHANHRFAKGGKNIKYVTPTFDMRTSDIHRIEFHGMENKFFSITNENADKDLYLWVLDWLLGKEVENE